MKNAQISSLSDILSILHRVTTDGINRHRPATKAPASVPQMEWEDPRTGMPMEVERNSHLPVVVSGKITLAYGEDESKPDQLVELTIGEDGRWEAEFVKPVKRAARKKPVPKTAPVAAKKTARKPMSEATKKAAAAKRAATIAAKK